MPGFVLGVRLVLAAVFAVAGVAKLLDAAGSRGALEGFGVPRRAARLAGPVLPVAELAIAAGLLVPASAWWSALAAAGLLAVFMAAIGVSMARGAAPGCHCFGRLHSAPVSWRTQLRNGVLAAAGGVAVLAGRGASGLSPVRWACQLNAAELGLAAAVAVLCAVAAGQGWFLYGLSRQNGRVLARLENLEQRIGIGGPPATAGLAGVRHASGQGPVRGLAVGVPAPEFELPAADGRRVSLRALLGRGLPVLLLFSVPGCGHCDALLPQVAAGSTSIATASRLRSQPGDLPGRGRHAADTRAARCAFASQPRNRRGLPGKRHPERSADRRQRKNREPPGLGRAGNHPAHPQRNHQRPPGRPSGGTRRQRRGTKLTRQARTCRRRRGTRPCADRSTGPCRARPAGPGSASADTASRALKREVPLSKINPAAWRDFPVHCYSRAAARPEP